MDTASARVAWKGYSVVTPLIVPNAEIQLPFLLGSIVCQKNFALLDIVNETAPKQQAGNKGHSGMHECEACDEKHPAAFICLDCNWLLYLFSVQNITINSAFLTKIVVVLFVETVTPLIIAGTSV